MQAGHTRCLVFVAAVLACPAAMNVRAEPLAAPGDVRFRQDLQLLNDSGLTDIPLTTWPISLGNVDNALNEIDPGLTTGAAQRALERTRFRLSRELDRYNLDVVFGAAGAENPRIIRSFENTPRENGEGFLKLSWLGQRFSINLAGHYVSDPVDGDEFRPDDTYVGMALGNWVLTAGWQDRWYGPGRNSSLILSNNARPAPGLMLQRNNSTPFASKWLSWIGPWSLTTFMSQLDDEGGVEDALLFGIRGTFRPIPSLEIGVTRTAQWCGEDRPCDFSTFLDLLVGNDNRGVNVDPDSEPGNQLAGVDLRWRLPRDVPAALYLQWIAEDGAPGNRLLGSWLRQVGIEHWGSLGDSDYSAWLEVADTACNDGAYGFGDIKEEECAYQHSIYTSGYRYKHRALAHSADGDSLTYATGASLVQSGGQAWNATLRYMEINRAGLPDPGHSLSPTPIEVADFFVTYDRDTRYGRFYIGLGFQAEKDLVLDTESEDWSGFIQWSSR
jgi:hypothetical protein